MKYRVGWKFVGAVFSALLFHTGFVNAADATPEPSAEKPQSLVIKQQFAQELAALQKLEGRLNKLADEYDQAVKDGDSKLAEKKKASYLQLRQEYEQSLSRLQHLQHLYKSIEAGTVDKELSANMPQSDDNVAVPSAGSGTARKANQSQSVEALLQEEHALFNRRLTLEAGFTYSHSNRKQLTLNGFLALDAIFLGNIALEGVDSDIYRYDLSARYGLDDRTNLNLNLPFIQRTTTYQKGGAGGATAILGEAHVSRDPTLGDVGLGMSYQLIKEGPDKPDVVWNISLLAPTGEHPYGVPTVTHPTSDENVVLEVPAELPTGSGVWALTTGFSVVRTLDPAIIFGNIAYTYTLPESFSDIHIDPGNQPGKVDLGNVWQLGMGIAFAFNDRLSMNLSYSQSITRVSKTKDEGGRWQNIIGSQANSASLGVGVTFAMSKHLSMITAVGAGLTDDAPDVTFSLKFPYMF